LNGARGRRGLHAIALRRIRGGVVPERLLPVQLEDLRGEETALGVALAAIEIDGNLKWLPCISRHTFSTAPCGGVTPPDTSRFLSWPFPERDQRTSHLHRADKGVLRSRSMGASAAYEALG
jgi:hypothetical protein